MKKIIVLFFIFILSVSLFKCKQEIISDDLVNNKSLRISSFEVDKETALKVAHKIYRSQQNLKNERLSNEIDTTSFVSTTKQVKDKEGNLIMYLIEISRFVKDSSNSKYEERFFVISADRKVTPVLAMGENKIDFDGDNPGLKIWRDYVGGIIVDAKKTLSKPNPEIDALWQKYAETGVTARLMGSPYDDCTDPPCPGGPCPLDEYSETSVLLPTSWGQGEVYNYFCPTKSSCDCGKTTPGCGAVAAAQIMNFYQKPNTYVQGTSNYNIYYPLPNSVTYNSVINCLPNSSEIMIAGLIKRAAGDMYMTYGFSGCASFNWREDTKKAFQAASYSNMGTRKSWNDYGVIDAIRYEIEGGHPAIMDATTKFLGFNDWHIFDLDGFRRYKTYYKQDPNNPMSGCLGYEYYYFHINWGWNGSDNGFYGLNNFTGSGNVYDTALNVTYGMRP
ncbi:C10 family peptidase [Dyadobacter subterraneus]|uniref:C10 family peptidase n=1 Tax=Dyadobacter subterraneus TaxID=2773304 RepID=A0ABR9W8Y0_9BACT|nr:C10 family peptidase [Dyadobacter subterraneus]MBE9461936.1 C10 family peptidase [Dyadobacter subterraneus]